jgi:hypothetical protein
MTEQQRTRLNALPTLSLVALLQQLEGAVETVKETLVDRLIDLRDETEAIESELEDRGYHV